MKPQRKMQSKAAACSKRNSALIFFMFLFFASSANNLQVSNLRINLNNAEEFAIIHVDVSWENSWRTESSPYNWDAVWLFCKYQTADKKWHHAMLDSTGNIAPINGVIKSVPEKTGVFIYRELPGEGNVNYTDVSIKWNYDSVDINDILKIEVFALEMVYVPTGAFALGSGGTELNHFVLITINTADATVKPSGNTGILNTKSGGYPPGFPPASYTDYPNGYKAFYCMKYELTQSQYTDFLNTLEPLQATARYYDPASSPKDPRRYAIVYDTIAEKYYCNAPDLPLDFLDFKDGAAYADWAGLRPMTELEFEKACRGTAIPVANEFAWGTTQIYHSDYEFINCGSDSELIANPSIIAGNAIYRETLGSLNGPARVGIFAASSPNHSRIETGASFYGIMELSGSIGERIVNYSTIDGRNFRNINGDGAINSAGFANAVSWPAVKDGGGTRGGKFNSPVQQLRISDRETSNKTLNARDHNIGWRFVYGLK
ncbi:MAG: SUMF1/EgtB/PvdO family nonheme iron enzyme [Fimbriimonadaceae bacterium]|nr:SUMF1/EgtB/PvdO family nonheme iron enzyme [Chitinophagales bacterium]